MYNARKVTTLQGKSPGVYAAYSTPVHIKTKKDSVEKCTDPCYVFKQNFPELKHKLLKTPVYEVSPGMFTTVDNSNFYKVVTDSPKAKRPYKKRSKRKKKKCTNYSRKK